MSEDVGSTLPTIEEILEQMDVEVDRTMAADDRRGYFALMYRSVTERVRVGIQNEEFPDNALMEQLDVLFARRWLDACDGWWADTEISAPWEVAFRESTDERHIILQHLLLGINAHINLDLGIAAADTIDRHPELTIDDLQDDFGAINDVLASLIDTMQDAMASVSPWMGLVDWVSARLDEGVAGFAIEIARDSAWDFAQELSALPPDQRGQLVGDRATAIAGLGNHIAHPSWPIRVAVWIARQRETHDLAKVMAALDSFDGVRHAAG